MAWSPPPSCSLLCAHSYPMTGSLQNFLWEMTIGPGGSSLPGQERARACEAGCREDTPLQVGRATLGLDHRGRSHEIIDPRTESLIEGPRGLSLACLLAGFCLSAGAASRPGFPKRPFAGPRPDRGGSRAQAQAPWAEVFPPGTAAGLATQAQDGGFVFAGQTTAAGAGGLDLWLLKLDASGTAVWQETLGTAEDDAGTLMASPAGGFIAQGWSAVSEGFWLVRLDESGTPVQEQVDLPPGRGEIDAAFPQDAGCLLTGTVVNPLFQKTSPALVSLDDLGGIVAVGLQIRRQPGAIRGYLYLLGRDTAGQGGVRGDRDPHRGGHRRQRSLPDDGGFGRKGGAAVGLRRGAERSPFVPPEDR